MNETDNLFTQTKSVKIENAYNKLLLYGQEVADFLLYVTGTHPHNDEHWVENARRTVIHLRDMRSQALILGTLLFQYCDSEYVFSDGTIFKHTYLYAEYLDISRNAVSWLNAANSYLREWVTS